MSVFELFLTGCGVLLFAASFIESRKFIKQGKRVVPVKSGVDSSCHSDASSDDTTIASRAYPIAGKSIFQSNWM